MNDYLTASINKDFNYITQYFINRWNQPSFQFTEIQIHSEIGKLCSYLKKDSANIKSKLINEIEDDLEYIATIQDYDLTELFLYVIKHEHNLFQDYYTQKPTASFPNEYEILNTITAAEFNDADLSQEYIYNIGLSLDILKELAEESVRSILKTEISFQVPLKDIISGINLLHFDCRHGSTQALSNIHFNNLIPELGELSSANWDESNLSDKDELKHLTIDILYLYAYSLCALPIKPIKPTKHNSLIQQVCELKDCLIFAKNFEYQDYNKIQAELRSAKHDALKAQNSLNNSNDGRIKGNQKKHRFVYKYKPLIELAAQSVKSEQPNWSGAQIITDERLQTIIKQCRDEQILEGKHSHQLMKDRTFITWINAVI
ncbi:hypothetical protein JCM30760_21080 [Thiomicrorhabdus hydrogeniphila]